MERRLRPVTITDAAYRLGLPRTTVASWASRGWIDQNGNRQHLTIVDHGGPKQSPRYWLKDIEAAEFQIGLNNRRSHRRSERWQKIQADRIEQFTPAYPSPHQPQLVSPDVNARPPGQHASQ